MLSCTRVEQTLFTAVVKGRVGRNTAWKETAEIVSISHTGGGFYSKRECLPGQLISLLMAMPLHFRRYDYDKKLYKIWGLVQHCSPIISNGKEVYHVGVAFVGRSAPAGHYRNPCSSYRVCGVTKDGFWQIHAIDSAFQARREPRFWKPIDVTIFELNKLDQTVRDERTFTENISESGASVISFLNVNAGDRVRVYCQKYDFSAYALVRNRQSGKDDRPRIHLEFVDRRFPVAYLDAVSDK
jgi:hypothetical protein